MVITLIGQTDKRPVIYTMLKMCEYVGDCAIVSNDRKLQRLMEEGPGEAGTYRNVSVFVTDATADEVWVAIDRSPGDFDFCFLDNLYTDDTDLVLYVKGAGVDEVDQMTLEAFDPDELFTIKMGTPDKAPKLEKGVKPKLYNIPYTGDMMERIEKCEFYRELIPASNQAVKVCAEILASASNVPAKTYMQVATRSGQKGAMKK